MTAIDDLLRTELTDAQYAAATDPAAEVLTLACAGSGKSRALAFRIARLLSEGEPPEGIVAFTFTEKAAESIKLRVARALSAVGLDPMTIGAMYIGTIHAYCKDRLAAMDASFRQFEVLDENRLQLYLLSRYPQLRLAPVRRARSAGMFRTIREVADAWQIANDELIDPRAVAAADPEMGDALAALDKGLQRDQYLDFSLMIRLVVDALVRGDEAAEAAFVSLRHLMVDEYQDVNTSQERLIRELHERSETLFVVGDDDQALYGWRGADVTNILEFNGRYPDCSEHTLSKNFRSTEAIVQSADDFVAAELGATRIEKDPTAANNDGPRDLRVLWFPDRPTEAEWVAERIAALLGTAYTEQDGTVRGLTPADFAILMRSTRTREVNDGPPRHAAFTDALDALDIPYSLEAAGSIFDRPHVALLRDTFELLRDRSPGRRQAKQHFETHVQQLFPDSDFDAFTRVLTDWGRLIHDPGAQSGGPRRRVYPQGLLHDLLEAFGLPSQTLDEGTMHDIGVFSRILQDVETVYLSVDSARRFREVLNFLQNAAEHGYDAAPSELLLRPDAVTVTTVHKMKGLEFPAVFVVDVENQRFPKKRRGYTKWLPEELIEDAVARGSYQSTRDEEARLFYTALTRAERYLHVTGCEHLPGGKRDRRPSPFAQQLAHAELSDDPAGLPSGLTRHDPQRRIDETIMPTTYSDIRYYLRCPHDYRLRKVFGFSPPITEMFGFGITVHAAVGRLHERYGDTAPSVEEAEEVVRDTFHLKHVPPSSDPENRPGAYERARGSAASIVSEYARDYSDDFSHERQVEVRFEIPVALGVITGTIDLLLRYDDEGNVLEARVIDFKTMEGGPDADDNERLDWTELALQVQLYARAAREVLTENARTGAVHFLKDGQRVEVPVDDSALEAAVGNVEWAVERIITGDFPRRPHPDKCGECDFAGLCPRTPEAFSGSEEPPPIHVPGEGSLRMARAFSEFSG